MLQGLIVEPMFLLLYIDGYLYFALIKRSYTYSNNFCFEIILIFLSITYIIVVNNCKYHKYKYALQ